MIGESLLIFSKNISADDVKMTFGGLRSAREQQRPFTFTNCAAVPLICIQLGSPNSIGAFNGISR